MEAAAGSVEERMGSRALGRQNVQGRLGREREGEEKGRAPGVLALRWPQQNSESLFPFQSLRNTESYVPCFALSLGHRLLGAKYQVLLCPGQHLAQDLPSKRYSVNSC